MAASLEGFYTAYHSWFDTADQNASAITGWLSSSIFRSSRRSVFAPSETIAQSCNGQAKFSFHALLVSLYWHLLGERIVSATDHHLCLLVIKLCPKWRIATHPRKASNILACIHDCNFPCHPWGFLRSPYPRHLIISDQCNSLHMFAPFEAHIKVACVWKQSMLDTDWHITLGCTLHPYCQTICKRNVLRTHTSESKVTSHLISPRWKKKPAAWLKDGVAATGLPLLPQLPVLKFLPFLQGARDTWELHNSTYLQPSHSAPKTPAISTLRIWEAMQQRHQCYTCRTAENRKVHEDTQFQEDLKAHVAWRRKAIADSDAVTVNYVSVYTESATHIYNEICKSSRHLLPSFSYNKSNQTNNWITFQCDSLKVP